MSSSRLRFPVNLSWRWSVESRTLAKPRLDISEAKRLTDPGKETQRLKKHGADQALDIQILKELDRGNSCVRFADVSRLNKCARAVGENPNN